MDPNELKNNNINPEIKQAEIDANNTKSLPEEKQTETSPSDTKNPEGDSMSPKENQKEGDINDVKNPPEGKQTETTTDDAKNPPEEKPNEVKTNDTKTYLGEKPMDPSEFQNNVNPEIKQTEIDTNNTRSHNEEKPMDPSEFQNNTNPEKKQTEIDTNNAKNPPKEKQIEKDTNNDKKQPIKKEQDYTLETIEGHEEEVFKRFIETKDPKYSKLLTDHFSKCGQKIYANIKMLFDYIPKLKNDEVVTDFLLTTLSSYTQIFGIGAIGVLLKPDYVLSIHENGVKTVVSIIKALLSRKMDEKKKGITITSVALKLLETKQPKGLPEPLLELLVDVASQYKDKLMAYEPILTNMLAVDISGKTLECEVKILRTLINQQSSLTSHQTLIRAYEKYGSNASFFDFFLLSCSKLFSKVGPLVPKDGASPDSFAQLLSSIILDGNNPHNRDKRVITTLSSIFGRARKPKNAQTREQSLRAVHAFITDNKDDDTLIAGLTIVRGIPPKALSKELTDMVSRITYMLFDYPQATGNEKIVRPLVLITQRETVRREITEKELEVLTLFVHKYDVAGSNDGVSLLTAITGIAANVLRANDAPSTQCDKAKTLINTITNKISKAPAPINSMLLLNVFMLIKNAAVAAYRKGSYGDVFSQHEEQFVKVLSDYAPFLYDAHTKNPASALVKYLIKTLLETAFMLTYMGGLPRKLYDAVDNFYLKFDAQNGPKDKVGKADKACAEIKNLITNIYLVNTSKNAVGKALLIESKCNILQKLAQELEWYSSKPSSVDLNRLIMIFGIFCNVLCLDVPSSKIDISKIVKETLNLLGGRDFKREVIVAGTRLVWRIASRKGGKALVTKHKVEFVKCFERIMGEIGGSKKSSSEDVALILNTFIFMVNSNNGLMKELKEEHVKQICDFAVNTKVYEDTVQISVKLISFLMKQPDLHNHFIKHLSDKDIKRFIST